MAKTVFVSFRKNTTVKVSPMAFSAAKSTYKMDFGEACVYVPKNELEEKILGIRSRTAKDVVGLDVAAVEKALRAAKAGKESKVASMFGKEQ